MHQHVSLEQNLAPKYTVLNIFNNKLFWLPTSSNLSPRQRIHIYIYLIKMYRANCLETAIITLFSEPLVQRNNFLGVVSFFFTKKENPLKI